MKIRKLIVFALLGIPKGIGEAGNPRVQRQQINGHCIEPWRFPWGVELSGNFRITCYPACSDSWLIWISQTGSSARRTVLTNWFNHSMFWFVGTAMLFHRAMVPCACSSVVLSSSNLVVWGLRFFQTIIRLLIFTLCPLMLMPYLTFTAETFFEARFLRDTDASWSFGIPRRSHNSFNFGRVDSPANPFRRLHALEIWRGWKPDNKAMDRTRDREPC